MPYCWAAQVSNETFFGDTDLHCARAPGVTEGGQLARRSPARATAPATGSPSRDRSGDFFRFGSRSWLAGSFLVVLMSKNRGFFFGFLVYSGRFFLFLFSCFYFSFLFLFIFSHLPGKPSYFQPKRTPMGRRLAVVQEVHQTTPDSRPPQIRTRTIHPKYGHSGEAGQFALYGLKTRCLFWAGKSLQIQVCPSRVFAAGTQASGNVETNTHTQIPCFLLVSFPTHDSHEPKANPLEMTFLVPRVNFWWPHKVITLISGYPDPQINHPPLP